VEAAGEEGGEVILGAWAVIVLYPFFVLAVFLASFMAAWDTHLFMAFVYWALTAAFLPWWRSNPAYKSAVGWVLGLQGCALFVTALVSLAK
jgi:hypothetical protein